MNNTITIQDPFGLKTIIPSRIDAETNTLILPDIPEGWSITNYYWEDVDVKVGGSLTIRLATGGMMITHPDKNDAALPDVKTSITIGTDGSIRFTGERCCEYISHL